jgi:non-canonical purine NTP pyrophosphatase (RdgB/HAM1 family)
MTQITFVTGNPNKLREIKEIAPPELNIISREIDLPEIQSLDMFEIIEDKVKRAYAHIKGPVIVEDVSAGLDDLEGLPGPFYKYFSTKLGETALLKLSKTANSNRVTIHCIAAYFDGDKVLYGQGVIRGKVVEPSGKNGFGFDSVVVPDGESRTMAEMTTEEKHKISHRGKAFIDLLSQI